MRLLMVLLVSALLSACSPAGVYNRVALLQGGAEVRRDVAYGEGPRRRLDVYLPRGGGRERPVLVFLYGGAWNSGQKADYGFVGAAFAGEGFVTVIPDYRLVPEVRYPGFLEDNAAAVAWARAHAAELGGDPERIVLVGHSAGAYNAAMLALDPRWLRGAGAPGNTVRAWAGLAGPYDFLPLDDEATIRTFGGTEDLPATQPINVVDRGDPPTLLVTGAGDERVDPVKHIAALSARLRAADVPVATKSYPGVGHVGLALALGPGFRGRAPVLRDTAAFLKANSD